METGKNSIRWWVPLVAIALAWVLTLLSCRAYQTNVPMVLRPDTRRLMEITLDSTAFIETKTLLRSVFPKEAALCLYGNVRQVVGEKSDTSLIATITKVSPAVIDSANEFHVWFPILSGCENDLALIAAAHSHTTLGFPCTHSFADAMVLFNDKRLLFTLVFCADGFTEALYQDGRRALARWAP